MTKTYSDRELGDMMIKLIPSYPALKIGKEVNFPNIGKLKPKHRTFQEAARIKRTLSRNINAKIKVKLKDFSLAVFKKVVKLHNKNNPAKYRVKIVKPKLKTKNYPIMSTKLPDSKTFDREMLDAGSYPAVCYGIAIIGTFEQEFKGNKKMVKKVRIFWELPEEKYTIEFPDNEPKEFTHVVSQTFTFSNSTNGNLFKMLKVWSSNAITAEKIKTFDLSNIVGYVGAISVEKKTSKNGNEYVNFTGIAPLMKGTPKPEMTREKFIFDIDEFDKDTFMLMPKWVREEVSKSEEFKELGLNIEDYINDKNSENSGKNEPEDESEWA